MKKKIIKQSNRISNTAQLVKTKTNLKTKSNTNNKTIKKNIPTKNKNTINKAIDNTKISTKFKKEKLFNIANILSISRFIILPYFIYKIYIYKINPSNDNLIHLVLLVVIVGLTDFFDGFLARRLKQQTRFGHFIDPICDKFFSISAFTLLLLYFDFPLWIYILYIIRDIFGSVMTTFLYFKRSTSPNPNYWGKIGVALSFLLLVWYIVLPQLKLYFPADHILLKPELLAYLWLSILLVSVYKYYINYRAIVFFKKN